jgi:uncharacterized protein (DUF983 family)
MGLAHHDAAFSTQLKSAVEKTLRYWVDMIILKRKNLDAFSLADFPSLAWYQRLYLAVLKLRCPHCGCGELYEKAYRLHKSCGVCGVRFERSAGDWTGAVVLAYSLAAFLGFGFWVLLYTNGMDFKGSQYAAGFVAVAPVLLIYRNIKGMWTWLLYATSYLTPENRPEDRPENRNDKPAG